MSTGGMTATGVGNATASAIKFTGDMYMAVNQYKTARMMLRYAQRRADRDFAFEMFRFGEAEALQESMENIQKFKNETMVENAELHSDKAIAEARLAEQEKTEESTRIRNKELVKKVLEQRGKPYYGSPISAT